MDPDELDQPDDVDINTQQVSLPQPDEQELSAQRMGSAMQAQAQPQPLQFDPTKPFKPVEAPSAPSPPSDQNWTPTQFDPSKPFNVIDKPPPSLLDRAGKEINQLRGRAEDVDYTSGPGFGFRTMMARAENPAEAKKLLDKYYGEGNYGQDKAGNYWVNQDGKKVAVSPSGFWQGVENFGAGLVGSASPMAGAIAGGAAGAELGGPFAPFTGAVGAGAGAAVGWGMDQLVKYYQGLYDQTPQEAVKHASNEAALNTALAGALPAARAVASPAADALRGFLGTTPTTQAMTERLVNEGARPPIRSAAPDFRSWGDKQILRNLVAGDPWEETNAGIVRDKFAGALRSSGASDAEIADFMKESSDPLSSLPTRPIAEKLSASVQSRLGQFQAEAIASRNQAQQQLGQMEQQLRTWANPPDELGHDVAGSVIQARRDFSAAASQSYKAIDNMTGNQPVFSMGPTVNAAKQWVDMAEPGMVPPYVRRLAERDPTQPVTFEEAHELRTNLRELLGGVDLTRTPYMHKISDVADAIDGTFKAMEGMNNLPGQAAQALRAMDNTYRQGIAKFYNFQINKLVRDVKSGIAPNPEVVAGTVIRDGQDAAARQILKMVPDDVRMNVFKADMRNIIADSSRRAPDGTNQLDGMAFLNQLDRRAPIYREFYGQQGFESLRGLGANLAALDGKIDVSKLPPSQVPRAIGDYINRTRQIDEFVKGNPVGALASGRPEIVDRAVQAFSQPGKEAMTESAMRFFGETSEEWKGVQKAAQARLIKSALVETPSRNLTVDGNAIERALARYTPMQQEMLFPNGMAQDLKEVAKDARFLFPKGYGTSGGDMASSLAAKSITLHTGINMFNPRTAYADMKWIYTSLMGWVTDRPMALRFLADASRSDPRASRALIAAVARWIINEQQTGPGRGKISQQEQPMPPSRTLASAQ